MKKKNIGKTILSAVIFIVVFVAVWNLLDFLYCTYITRSGYHFSFLTDAGAPILITALVIFVLLPMYNRDMEKSVDREKDFKEKRHHSAPKEDE